MEISRKLIRDLPDPAAATRFLDQMAEQNPAASAKVLSKDALLSDVLTLVSFSPLLATTMLQNPEYIAWLDKRRRDSGVRSVEELVESLAQFKLTNTITELPELFARFRRRELLRIYLRDIRRLATIAEITEEISNLADAILEAALGLARVEIDDRYGQPQETDTKDRARPASFCIAALGKLGSRELNYSSDIDLLFIYSAEGSTTDRGTRGGVTNREYFIKLAEYVTKLLGLAYRVDVRLRPHGSLGPLAVSVADISRYFRTEARAWERQVLIRSRGSAGDVELFRNFAADAGLIFSRDETVESALASVRRSKDQIDREQARRSGFNVKLGRGGIREIEFISQALQLAHGGRDAWLRAPHTLISLDRLGDRRLLTEDELTGLASAYDFLRRTEHVLQMENGLQTHTVPDNDDARLLLGRRMAFATGVDFEQKLTEHTACVSRVAQRVFGGTFEKVAGEDVPASDVVRRTRKHLAKSIHKSDVDPASTARHSGTLERISAVSPHFAAMLAANPQLAAELPDLQDASPERDYATLMMDAVESEADFGSRLGSMRRKWSRLLLEIAVRDIFQTITIREAKDLQTRLAEATIAAALRAVGDEMTNRVGTRAASGRVGAKANRENTRAGSPRSDDLDVAILALGKLGGCGLDYDSDLDLVITYFDPKRPISGFSPLEYYSRVVELFVTALSSMTREGNLYRVDLRLRPFGAKGMAAMSIDSFLDYMREKAAIWEMLAFVKLRHVGGLPDLGFNVENETRRIIHERAAAISPTELADETGRMRDALEKKRTRVNRRGEIDIKYGMGGMLDVYFAMRFLQLRWNVPDVGTRAASLPMSDKQAGSLRFDVGDRSTAFMLERLTANSSLAAHRSSLISLRDGYDFLSTLDHNLRLTVGRTTKVPLANKTALAVIAERMNLPSAEALIESLALYRISIRAAYEACVSV